MSITNPYWERLEVDLLDTSGIIVPKDEDEADFYERLRASVRENATEPEWISATVVEPGFQHREIGSTISGHLLARADGSWLVFEPIEREYYCFWGATQEKLWAHGISGNPLYCWWE
jgi:hypothetical protein